jgi:16S rRNA C1402 N4-methylase RsmH
LSGQEHIAVLSREVCENLIGTGCKVFVDATIGGAGHSSACWRDTDNYISSVLIEIRKHSTGQKGPSKGIATG